VFVAREDAPDLKAVVRNIDSRKYYGASLNYTAKPENQNQPPDAQQQRELDRLERARIRAEQLRELYRQRGRERGLER